MSTPEPDVTVRPSPDARYCVGPGTLVSTARPSTQIESSRMSVVLLQAASLPIITPAGAGALPGVRLLPSGPPANRTLSAPRAWGWAMTWKLLANTGTPGVTVNPATGTSTDPSDRTTNPSCQDTARGAKRCCSAAGSWSSWMPLAGSSS